MEKMKHLKSIFLSAALVVMTLLFSLALAACGEEEAHAHTLTHHAKVDATCTTAGTKEYWSCELCKKNFSDAEGKTETSTIESPLAAHTLEKVEATAPTCVTDGCSEHYHCEVCGKNFSDAEGKTEATDAVIAADGTSHQYAKENDGWVKSSDATCTANAKEKRTCLVEGCGHEEEREIPNSKLAHDYDENGECKNCDDKNGPKEKIGAAPVKRGDNEVEFGSYPQTEVTNDETLSSTLLELAGKWSEDNDKWIAYDYWNREDGDTLMYYSDVSYSGKDYRGVYINLNRPKYPNYPSFTTYPQNENGYSAGQTYWFQWEPIRWTILENKDDGTSFIVSKNILDSQPFQNSDKYKGPNGNSFPSNYAESTIRKFLKEYFLNWAFTELEQTYIDTTHVDNSKGTANNSNYTCEDTEDKVFLLSYLDCMNYDLGNSGETSDKRVKAGTNYASAQGLRFDDGTAQMVPAGNCWWLRSPYDKVWAHRISGDGRLGPYSYNYDAVKPDVDRTDFGVVPAMNIHFEAAKV